MIDAGSYETIIAMIASFMAIFSLVILFIGRLLREDARVKLRVERMLVDVEHSTTSLKLTPAVLSSTDEIQFLKPGSARKSSLSESVHRQLKQGGINTRRQRLTVLITVSVLSIISAFAVWMILWNLGTTPSNIVLGTIGALSIFPLFIVCWLRRRHQRYLQVMLNSLSDFMDLIVVCLESGLSLDGALRRVSQELEVAHPILAAEMKQVQKEIELGTTLENAFYNLSRRTGLEVIATMACFIEQSRKYGTSISDALREHSDMLRLRRETRAETMAQQASIKILLPTLLLIFPATFVVLAGPAVMEVTAAFENSTNTESKKSLFK